jgi:hypothetical protein
MYIVDIVWDKESEQENNPRIRFIPAAYRYIKYDPLRTSFQPEQTHTSGPQRVMNAGTFALFWSDSPPRKFDRGAFFEAHV